MLNPLQMPTQEMMPQSLLTFPLIKTRTHSLWSFSAIWLPFGQGKSNSHVIIRVSVTSGVLSAVTTSSLTTLQVGVGVGQSQWLSREALSKSEIPPNWATHLDTWLNKTKDLLLRILLPCPIVKRLKRNCRKQFCSSNVGKMKQGNHYSLKRHSSGIKQPIQQ